MLSKKISREEFLKWFKPFYDILSFRKKENVFIRMMSITDVINTNEEGYISVEIGFFYGPFGEKSAFADYIDYRDEESDYYDVFFYFDKKDFHFINMFVDTDDVYHNNPNFIAPEFENLDVNIISKEKLSNAVKVLCEMLKGTFGRTIHAVDFLCDYPESLTLSKYYSNQDLISIFEEGNKYDYTLDSDVCETYLRKEKHLYFNAWL